MIKRKIGLFGGTFDPIHLGHLNLAMELKEKRALDEIWFIPAQINPLKVTFPPASVEHRLAMLALAIQGFPHFFIKDLELQRKSPSYTVDTLSTLIQLDSQSQFFWLMGEDVLLDFDRWHQPEKIIGMATLLIGSRLIHKPTIYKFDNPLIQKAVQLGWTKTNLIDISSSTLRLRLSQNLFCGHLLPTAVWQYIDQHQLYLR